MVSADQASFGRKFGLWPEKMAEREKLLGYGNLTKRGLRLAADKARPTGTQVQLVDL